MENLFFDNFENLLRVVISAPLVYVAIIIFIRLSGKRSTSQMNNFDWIVTVSLGSITGSAIVLKDVTVAETIAAIATLLLLQFVVTKTVFHSDRVERLVKAEPTLVLRHGAFLTDAMRDERVTEGEIWAAIRGHGIASLDAVDAVVLETDATFSVIPASSTPPQDLKLHR